MPSFKTVVARMQRNERDATAAKVEARRKMKCVMKVWTGKLPLAEAAKAFHATPAEVERWCRTAIRGAKKELANA